MMVSNAREHPVKIPSQLELVERAGVVDVDCARCPRCDQRIDPLEIRDKVVVKLMNKILRLRSRLAELDPGCGL